MSSLSRRVIRIFSASAALSLMISATPSSIPADNINAPSGETPSANNRGEVRLRKLHLVRPDLIPYPIAYEVYC